MKLLLAISIAFALMAADAARAHTVAPWCDFGGNWWCKHHDRAPGRDDDRRADRRDDQVERPEPSDPPAQPETCKGGGRS